ncbi:MAG: hypothetical protein ABJE95_29100 [Byssovorax sp.]
MRRALILCVCLFGAALAACGGSSSETPWPAEPENAALGPAGESGASTALDRLPDAGAPRPVKSGETVKTPY